MKLEAKRDNARVAARHEPRFHIDDQAAALAGAAHARAVTIGTDVYFGRGQYQPETPRGRELIAHELVHVAQSRHGTSWSAAESAEREASTLSRTSRASLMTSPPVTSMAAPIMFDRIPDPDLSQDKALIIAHLRLTFPYLERLSNRDIILDTFAEYIRHWRRARELSNQLQKIPAIKNGLSAAIDRRERERAPFLKQQAANAQAWSKVSQRIVINPLEILASDFYDPVPERGQRTDKLDKPIVAGRVALAKEMAKKTSYLQVDRGGFDAFGFGITGYIGGAWLPIKADGIHPRFYEEDSTMTYTRADLERAYLDGFTTAANQDLEAEVDEAPFLGELELDRMIEESREAHRLVDEPTDDEKIVLDIQGQRSAYAASVKDATISSVAPLVLLASFFAVEGPLDLLLAVAPVHKLGKGFTIGKKALGTTGAKALEKIGKELLEHLDDEAKLFLKTAAKLSKSEIKALKTIFTHTKSPAVIKTLMNRHAKGLVDVKWIAKKLEKKKLDGTFVEQFTHYPGGPSWKTLEDVVERRTVDATKRADLASKLTGLFGEEAAEKFVRAQTLAGKTFGKRAGAKVSRIARTVEYGGKKSMDLLAYSDKGELLFGEVKNWASDSWTKGWNTVLDHIDDHNKGITQITKRMHRGASKVTDRVLYVAEKGFMDWDAASRAKFISAVGNRGWTIEMIPDKYISDFGGLIDRLR